MTSEVLMFIRDSADLVRATDLVAYFGMSGPAAGNVISILTGRGLIVRVGRGLYSGDTELRRRALEAELDRLTPA